MPRDRAAERTPRNWRYGLRSGDRHINGGGVSPRHRRPINEPPKFSSGSKERGARSGYERASVAADSGRLVSAMLTARFRSGFSHFRRHLKRGPQKGPDSNRTADASNRRPPCLEAARIPDRSFE